MYTVMQKDYLERIAAAASQSETGWVKMRDLPEISDEKTREALLKGGYIQFGNDKQSEKYVALGGQDLEPPTSAVSIDSVDFSGFG